MATGTISLKRKNVPQEREPEIEVVTPERVFDPDKAWAYVSGVPKVAFVQADAYFNAAHVFVEIAPEAAWYFPAVSPTQDRDARRRKASNLAQLVKNVPAVPASILEAEAENAKALAAEQFRG